MKLLLLLFIFFTIIVLFYLFRRFLLYKLKNNYLTKYTPKDIGCVLNKNKTKIGFDYLKTKKVIICGLIRDSKKNLYYTKNNLKKLTSLFNDYRILIVENDSVDNTRKELLKMAKKDPKITILGCGVNTRECKLNLKRTIFHGRDHKRIQKMVTLRNIYMDYIRNNDFEDYDFVAVMDLDFVGTFYIDGIASSGYEFKTNPKINAICANAMRIVPVGNSVIYHYYDTYALSYKNDKLYGRDPQNVEQWPLQCDDEKTYLQEVSSCFNGLTIYKKQALLSAKYVLDTHPEGIAYCEHRTLNAHIKGIYHNAKMILVFFE